MFKPFWNAGDDFFVFVGHGRIRVNPRMEIVNFIDLRLEHFFHASETGLGGRVNCPVGHGDPKPSGGQNGVLFRVHANAEIIPGPGRIGLSLIHI